MQISRNLASGLKSNN